MARNVRDKKLDTRTARQSLKVQREPHWKSIDRGFHIGYRKHKDGGGSWIARARSEDNKYMSEQMGKADDIQDADGVAVLSFSQAQELARKWYQQIKSHEKGVGIAKITVDHVLDDYVDYLKVHGKSAERAEYSIKAYIRPTFGKTLVSKLTSKQIADWHKELANEKPRQRSKRDEVVFNNDAQKVADYARKRKSSANRILTILKAALNRAYQEGKVANDDAWRRVKPFRNVENPKIHFLRPYEVERLVNACDPDFRKMVMAGYYTACRYGELTNARVSDFNPDVGTLLVSESKSGKPRQVTLTEEAQKFFRKEIMRKKGNDLIFTREDGGQWGKSHQTRRIADACKRAKIEPAISFHILRHTHASLLAQQGTPLPVIAHQLGHADTRICEKHYAHLTPNYVADTIRANFPKMDLGDEDDNVVSIEKAKG